MLILTLKVLVIWSLASMLIGFAMGAVIQKAERVHQDEFLTLLFATISSRQGSR